MYSTYSWFGSSSSCPNTWSGYTYRPLCMMHFEVSGCERILMRGYDKAILWPDVVSKWALCANKHSTLSLSPSLSTGSLSGRRWARASEDASDRKRKIHQYFGRLCLIWHVALCDRMTSRCSRVVWLPSLLRDNSIHLSFFSHLHAPHPI